LPAVGVSSPATMRNSVLLPQPEGPRIVMKSFSCTDRSVACSATVPPFAPGKVLETRLISRMVIGVERLSSRTVACHCGLDPQSMPRTTRLLTGVPWIPDQVRDDSHFYAGWPPFSAPVVPMETTCG